MPQTPIHHLPYPAPSAANDPPADLQALAAAVDPLLPGPYADLNIGAGQPGPIALIAARARWRQDASTVNGFIYAQVNTAGTAAVFAVSAPNLPVPALPNPAPSGVVVGAWNYYQTGVTQYAGVALFAADRTFSFQVNGDGARFAKPVKPGDAFSFTFIYEKA